MPKSALKIVMILALCGCTQKLEDQVKKSPNSIIGKTTQDIQKFDPNAGKKVSDSKIHATDPISAPLQAYSPAIERITKSQIEAAVKLFQATNDRYPKDYDEFMSSIIKENNIRLPVLPGNKKYEYDEKNHELVITENPAPAAATEAQPAAPQ